MFTGIITDIGRVHIIKPLETGREITLRTRYPMQEIAMGASIACDGACLTVIDKGVLSEEETHDSKNDYKGWFTVELSAETLERTTARGWKIGSLVNLERPMGVGGEFGGHFVTGHVDAQGIVKNFAKQGDFWLLEVNFPKEIKGYLAEKGSLTINGVSLTVNSVDELSAMLTIIPHTAENTNLNSLKTGDYVNLEIDLIARYVESLLAARNAT